MMQLSFSVLPFAVAMLLDLISPVTSWRVEQLIKNKLPKALGNNERQAVLDYANYATDSSQLISSTIISLASLVVLSVFTQNVEYVVLLMFGFFFLAILLSLYLGKTGPHRHAVQRIGPYGWVSILSIVLNGLLVTLIVWQGS